MEAQQIAEQRRVDLVNIGEAVSVYDGASHVQDILNNIKTLQDNSAKLPEVTQIAETRRVQLDDANAKIAELTKELASAPVPEPPAPIPPPAPPPTPPEPVPTPPAPSAPSWLARLWSLLSKEL